MGPFTENILNTYILKTDRLNQMVQFTRLNKTEIYLQTLIYIRFFFARFCNAIINKIGLIFVSKAMIH